MTHKTFRDMDKHAQEVRTKLRPLMQKIVTLTLEEVTMLMQEINRSIWLSFQTVEEKFEVTNPQENEQEPV